ncbi:MAG: zinc ribbon domain-containing protein, partial [Cyanobacteria bacterium REEB65]|nr:zinc ribbon domain-containing protein [Cyanobacteria bacterium REEB65]
MAEGSNFCTHCGRKLLTPCLQCGTETRPGQRFCAQCGSRLEAPEPPVPPSQIAPKVGSVKLDSSGDRRVVTVLFADVSGFTAMSERLDPEAVTEIVNNFFKVLVEPIYRYGGVVDKYIGDAIMALFGAPVAHEDDPERAVRAAWEMQAAAKVHAADLEARTGIGLKVRIGLNTGLVVAGTVGSSQRADYTVIGDTVNLAQRMEANARPGKVLVSSETWNQTSAAFDYVPLEPITVKGKSGLIATYELVGPKAHSGSHIQDDAPLIGRDTELACLDTCRQLAESGVPQWVEIIGDTGVGKSALVRRFIRSLKGERAPKILWGRALSYDQQPYLIPANLLRYTLNLAETASTTET